MAALLEPTRLKLTTDQYHRMGDAGIIAPDERVELIDGEIFAMAPIGSPHAWAVSQLARQFIEELAGRAVVYVQTAVHLSQFSEPEPDVMLLAPRLGGYRSRTPRPADVLLLVEVADSSRAFDFGRKLSLYAEHGIAEVWIVDLQNDALSAFSEPREGAYTVRRDFGPQDQPKASAFPEVPVSLLDIIG